MNSHKVSKLIKKIRADNSLTQQQLADELGVTFQAVSKWENKRNSPDVSTLQLLSEKYKVDISQVFTGGNEARRYRYMKRLVVGLGFALFLALVAVGILIKSSGDYSFLTIKSNTNDFTVKGVVATSNKKSSIYISSVDTSLDSDAKYKVLKSTLFELDGTQHTELTRCSDISSKPTKDCKGASLAELLRSMKFHVDNLPQKLTPENISRLYIEIDAINTEDTHINFKIPLKVE